MFPLLAVFLNVYLMINLPIETWYRFLVWFAVGLIIYLTYGMHHSKENKKPIKSLLSTLRKKKKKEKLETSAE